MEGYTEYKVVKFTSKDIFEAELTHLSERGFLLEPNSFTVQTIQMHKLGTTTEFYCLMSRYHKEK